jgi:hypothetical protein
MQFRSGNCTLPIDAKQKDKSSEGSVPDKQLPWTVLRGDTM